LVVLKARFIAFVLPAGPPEQPPGAVPRRKKHGGPKRLLWKERLEFEPLKFQMRSVGVAERARPKFWPKGPEFGMAVEPIIVVLCPPPVSVSVYD